jgi:hypothetical protein
MLRYQPPKSNTWGHSLRKMKPSKERALVGEFERIAISRSVFGASSLWICRISTDHAVQPEVIKRFELALKKESKEGYFHLTETEFEAALEYLISDEDGLPQLKGNVMLSKMVDIQEWRIRELSVPTKSRIHWVYGSSPHFSTFLRFNDREEFDFIQKVFEDLKICRLNEKHLKPVKRPA